MFELKKVVSSLLMPLPLMLMIGIVGLVLIMFTRKQKTGCFVVLFSFVGIFLISFQPIASRLLLPLERQYTAFFPVDGTIDYVMVLGSGHVVDDKIPPTSNSAEPAQCDFQKG